MKKKRSSKICKCGDFTTNWNGVCDICVTLDKADRHDRIEEDEEEE